MSKDVFVVIINDPCGAKILDSIHHHANGRGETYGKTGALARIREIERDGLRCELKRLKTGVKLSKSWGIEEL